MARRTEKASDSKKHGRRQLSDEQRRQLSERAKALHRAGKLGGKEFGRLGGRPRVKRASEAVSEAAQQHSAEIVKALRAGVREGAPEARSRSAERWLALAQKEDQLRLKTAEAASRERRDMSREAMLEALSQKLMSGPVAGLLRERLAEMPVTVDGTATEISSAQ